MEKTKSNTNTTALYHTQLQPHIDNTTSTVDSNPRNAPNSLTWSSRVDILSLIGRYLQQFLLIDPIDPIDSIH